MKRDIYYGAELVKKFGIDLTDEQVRDYQTRKALRDIAVSMTASTKEDVIKIFSDHGVKVK